MKEFLVCVCVCFWVSCVWEFCAFFFKEGEEFVGDTGLPECVLSKQIVSINDYIIKQSDRVIPSTTFTLHWEKSAADMKNKKLNLRAVWMLQCDFDILPKSSKSALFSLHLCPSYLSSSGTAPLKSARLSLATFTHWHPLLSDGFSRVTVAAHRD